MDLKDLAAVVAAIAATSVFTIHLLTRRTARRKALTDLISDLVKLRVSVEDKIALTRNEYLKYIEDGVNLKDEYDNIITKLNLCLADADTVKKQLDDYHAKVGMSFLGPKENVTINNEKLIRETSIKFNAMWQNGTTLNAFYTIKKQEKKAEELQREYDKLLAEKNDLTCELEAMKKDISTERAALIENSQKMLKAHLDAIPDK